MFYGAQFFMISIGESAHIIHNYKRDYSIIYIYKLEKNSIAAQIYKLRKEPKPNTIEHAYNSKVPELANSNLSCIKSLLIVGYIRNKIQSRDQIIKCD